MTPETPGEDLLPGRHRQEEARRVVSALHALESNIAQALIELDRLVDPAAYEAGPPAPNSGGE